MYLYVVREKGKVDARASFIVCVYGQFRSKLETVRCQYH